MSEQVDLKQVREAFCLLSNTEQRDTVLQMADELEALRLKNQVYCTFVMAEGLQEEFLDWMECDLASNQTGGNDNGNED